MRGSGAADQDADGREMQRKVRPGQACSRAGTHGVRPPAGGSLIVLHDQTDLQDALAAAPQALDGRVLAFDTDIHLELRARGISHATPWDFVARDDRAALERLLAGAWEHYCRSAILNYTGVNLLAMAAYRHLSCLARLTWAAFALRRVLEHTRPALIYAFDEPPAHGLDQPADARRMPLLSGILRGLAHEAGTRVQLLPRAADAYVDRVARRDRIRLPPANLADTPGEAPWVLFYGNGTELPRQAPLIREIRRHGRWKVVQLYKVAAEQERAVAAAAGALVLHESQVAPPGRVGDVAGPAAAARARFDACGERVAPELRCLFANPFIQSHFDFLFGSYAQKMAWHVRTWRAFFAANRPDAVVTSYQAPVLDMAADAKVPSLVLPHGLLVLGQPEQFTTLPAGCHIAAINPAHARSLRAAGIARERIHVTGDPWTAELTCPRAHAHVRARLGIAPPRRMILVCTGSYGMPSTTAHLPHTDWRDAVIQAGRLAELAGRRPQWAFVVKPHPRFDYPRLYEEINRGLAEPCRLIVAGQMNLGELAAAADVVCVWNVLTSALVEASLAGRPVIQCLPSVIWCDLDAWGAAAWARVDSVGALEAELERILSDPDHWSQRAAETLAAARAYVGDDPAGAPWRCVEAIESLETRAVRSQTTPQTPSRDRQAAGKIPTSLVSEQGIPR